MKDRKWWSTLWRSEPAPQRHSAPPQVSGRDHADGIPHISFSFLNESGTTVVKSPNISSINLQSVNTRHGEGTYSSPRESTELPASPSQVENTPTTSEPLPSPSDCNSPSSTPTPNHPTVSTPLAEHKPTLSPEDSGPHSPDGSASTTPVNINNPPSTPTTPVSSNSSSIPIFSSTNLSLSADEPSFLSDSPPVTPTTPESPITLTSKLTPPENDSETAAENSPEFSSPHVPVPTSDYSIATPSQPDVPSSIPIVSDDGCTIPSRPNTPPSAENDSTVIHADPTALDVTENVCGSTPIPETQPLPADVSEDTNADNPSRMSAVIVDRPEQGLASSTSTLVADSRPVSPRALTISLPLELGSCADWETITELSEYNKHDSDYEDVVTRDEYCEHRAQDPRRRRVRGTVRTRIRRAWRAVRGWWSEERLRITDVIQKHSLAQQPDDNVTRRRCTQRHDSSRPCSRASSRRSRYIPEGQNGFEELRRYIKQGGDFCKDLSVILQERSEAETQYAKSLSKLSGKLLKASRDSVGTVTQAWQRAGTQMEAQSEVHRAFATALSEEVVKPLRQLVESQHRIRKSVESAVDKTGKSLSEWRSAESKSKKQCFMSARENEKLQDAMLDVRLGRASSTTHLHLTAQHSGKDKDASKLESKRRKAEEAVKKADVEYYTFSLRAERARLEWETAVIRGSHCFQALEEERLQQLKDLATCYLNHLQEIGPKMVQGVERLREPLHICDVARDIQTVVSIKGTGQPIPEQLLPDFYAEHITLAMNRDRRRQALVKLLQLIRQDLDRERRGKQGVENLARALQQTPTFGAEDSQQNVTEKLHHMRSMLTYLEAMRYKVHSALAELDGRTRGGHPLAAHIQVTRDRQGLQQSVLKVPPWVREESLDRLAGDSPDWTDRGTADGNSVQPDSDFDEFSSQGSEKDYQSSVLTQCPVISQPPAPPTDVTPSIGTCKALYEYTANLYDELNLQPGDIIKIHDKQADGWWLGELNGVVGIFPATYVQEID